MHSHINYYLRLPGGTIKFHFHLLFCFRIRIMFQNKDKANILRIMFCKTYSFIYYQSKMPAIIEKVKIKRKNITTTKLINRKNK